jgi:dipeptidyl aminopeptidase/acylaminoacyl peptidase
MPGPLWQHRERYIENSPVFFLDRIQTPLLIIHGQEDTAVSPRQADEVFVGLRRLGKEAVYALYAGEGHEVNGRLANGIDFWNRVITWFDDHLKK